MAMNIVQLENRFGHIEISQEYFSNLIGNAASSCFGVSEMVASDVAQGFRFLIQRKRDSLNKGVKVRTAGGQLIVDLHIVVAYGLNITETVKSIVSKVRYVVEEATGLQVKKVNVFVDGMKA